MEGDPTSTKVRNYPRDIVTVNLAAEYPHYQEMGRPAGTHQHLGWRAPVRPQGQPGAQPPCVSVLPGIEYMATDKFSLALGVNIDLAGKDTTANITPLLSMVYAF